MSSTTSKIPLGTILINGFLISLFFIQVIIVSMMPGMPPIFWLIGIGCLIIGSTNLIKAYFKPKGRTPMTTVSPSTTISEARHIISDEELSKNYNRSKLFFIFGLILAAATGPFVLSETIRTGGITMTLAVFAVGAAGVLIGSFFMFMYKTNPEWYREFLAKRKKK